MSELKKPILKNRIKKNFKKIENQCQNAASEQKTSSNKLKFVSNKKKPRPRRNDEWIRKNHLEWNPIQTIEKV